MLPIRFRRALATWIRRNREQRELAALAPVQREAIGRDLGVPLETLRGILASGAPSGANLVWMTRSTGFCADEVERQRPEVWRDMLTVCGRCLLAGRCARERRTGLSPTLLDGHCPNAHTLTALQQEAARRPRALPVAT